MSDPVRDFLRRSGAQPSLIASGLRGILANWERVVDLIATGYPGTLEDYLNDMETRQLLEQALEFIPSDLRPEAESRLREADRRVRLELIPHGRCLWGGIVAEEEGWTPELNWWYFERPAHPGPKLQADLEAGG